ncbi:uncharacterized protein METZ01_LOCUS73779 [marine metagenome]|uniref:Uncharacterized protein n=1 Tax=marine metagenome TaxID=408172 RepID=A0A381TY46_9ZZZZ
MVCRTDTMENTNFQMIIEVQTSRLNYVQ